MAGAGVSADGVVDINHMTGTDASVADVVRGGMKNMHGMGVNVEYAARKNMFCILTNASARRVGKQFTIGSLVILTINTQTKGLISVLLMSSNANYVLLERRQLRPRLE